jgi:hypothetical protein
MTTPEIGFLSASLCLRPPRVAIVFPSDHRWRDWAMTALAVASEYWGGGGFILVPFDPTTGTANIEFADVVRAYDPDHIVTLQISLPTWEDWYPGLLNWNGVTDTEERKRLIANAHFMQADPAANKAREQVASWCSPMRVGRANADPTKRPMEVFQTIQHRKEPDLFAQGLPPAVPPTGARLAASRQWRSDLGLLAAMRVGVASAESEARPDPEPDDLNWLTGGRDDAPTSLIWNLDQIPTSSSVGLEPWSFVDQGLTRVGRGWQADGVAVVIGDTGEDFALAVAYERILGAAIWLTPALLDDKPIFARNVQAATGPMITELDRNAYQMALTSTSVSKRYLDGLAKRLRWPSVLITVDGKPEPPVAEQDTVQVRRAIIKRGFFDLLVDEHVGATLSLPVSKMADGTQIAQSGIETPVPSKLLFPESSGWVPYWYVDVSLAGDSSPAGSDVPSSALVVRDGPIPDVTARASKDGVSFNPRSMGFVSSGALFASRISRPRLRGLSVMAWAAAMAERDELGVRISFPGRQAELVSARLGSRQSLLNLVADGNLAMLRAFVRYEARPKPEQRDPEVVVIGLDPYLSFEAINRLLPGAESEAIDLVDRLIATRILRRGLILDCAECGRPSFVDVERLGQRFECPQCASMNDLVSRRWKEKRPEPRWFYDLYATFRELLEKHGDVVLLAASRLQRTHRGYADSPELEFFDLSTGKLVAEVDVVANVDREVVIVEAKANGRFKSKNVRIEQSAKLLRVARVLRADSIVLATTLDNWNQTDVSYLTSEGRKQEPFPVDVSVVERLLSDE